MKSKIFVVLIALSGGIPGFVDLFVPKPVLAVWAEMQAPPVLADSESIGFDYLDSDLPDVARFENQYDNGTWVMIAPPIVQQTGGITTFAVRPPTTILPGAHTVSFRACNTLVCSVGSNSFAFSVWTTEPQAACSDGIDNDGDGLTDFGTGSTNDPGCESASDTDETNSQPPPPTGCSTWTITPTPVSVPAAGGSFSGALNTGTTCAWTAYSTSGWLIVGATKGTGPATIPYTVQANTTTVGRAGNVIIVNATTGSMATNVAVHQVAAGSTPVPVDCVVSAWTLQSVTAWSACVDGVQTRSETWVRTIITQPANGGAVCPALTETRTGTQSCTVTPPPQPVDCVVSDWTFQSATAWSACVNSSQTRTETWVRSVLTQPANGGATCPTLTETRTGTQSCTVTPPPNPCVTDPLRVTRVSWPATNSGRRSLTFDTGTKTWAKFELIWPGALTVTDTRGCVATVTR